MAADTMYRDGKVYTRSESGEWVEATYLAVRLMLDDPEREALRREMELRELLDSSARTAGWGV